MSNVPRLAKQDSRAGAKGKARQTKDLCRWIFGVSWGIMRGPRRARSASGSSDFKAHMAPISERLRGIF